MNGTGTSERRRPLVAVVLLLLLSLILPAGPFGLRVHLAGLFAPLGLLGAAAGGGDAADPASAARLRAERDALRIERDTLVRENEALRQVGGMLAGGGFRGVHAIAAPVLMQDRAWPVRRSLLFGAGRDQGLRPGQPVVAGRVLVGFVVEADGSTARVRLLDDPGARSGDREMRLGALVHPGEERSDRRAVEGVLVGLRRGSLGLRMVPAGSVRVGDLVATSSADPMVPQGILVGRITSVRDLPREGLAEAEVEPAGTVAGLRTLHVLTTGGTAAPPGKSR